MRKTKLNNLKKVQKNNIKTKINNKQIKLQNKNQAFYLLFLIHSILELTK